jgi:hypothetical protein
VGDGDEKQVARLAAQQPVTFGDHPVPVVAAREPTTLTAGSGGTEIPLALLPIRVVLQLTGAPEPAEHLSLPFAALMLGLEIGQTQLGHDLAPLTISTAGIAGTLRKAGLVHRFCPGLACRAGFRSRDA